MPAHTLVSDASGHWGCGAFTDSAWFQVQWRTSSADYPIATKELIPIILAAIAWGKMWQGSTILARCDNEAVVAVINSRYSRDEQLMHLLRCLFFTEAKFQIHADNCRAHPRPSLKRHHIIMDPHPTPIPPDLIPALMASPLNWLFLNWTASWGSILSRV